jgi:hypothetical protein
MNDVNAVLAGRIEDKWIEFVATEFLERPREAARNLAGCKRAAECVALVEVHASYLWLFAGAMLAWFVS